MSAVTVESSYCKCETGLFLALLLLFFSRKATSGFIVLTPRYESQKYAHLFIKPVPQHMRLKLKACLIPGMKCVNSMAWHGDRGAGLLNDW